ncbi:hypothetical protein ACFSN5_06685 [Streptococcus tangpeifui]|uniref:hypothetical protein n=1 Tax=Streptococcus tangpeifui TaxID=2709400 RepID=UPI0013EC7695|nr:MULTISPECIES: hypothetical protein [unclassified Streptococcus]
MALKLTEEIVSNLVAEYNQINPAFQIDWKTYIYGTAKEGSGRSSQQAPLLWFENDYYFVLIYLATLNVSKIQKVKVIDKDEIQGVKIKYGGLNAVVKIRMTNGAYYNLRLARRNYKTLPRQLSNLDSLMEVFHLFYSDRIDMKDHSTSIGAKVLSAATTAVLVILAILFIFLTKSRALTYLLLILAIFLGGLIWTQAETFINKQRDRAFVQAFEQTKQLVTSMTESQYYQALQGIDVKPKTQMMQESYLKVLISIAHNLGLDKEARAYLTQFPRRYSADAEETYLGLINLLASNQKVPYEFGQAPLDVEQDIWQKYQ